jgi:hypothetical protein
LKSVSALVVSASAALPVDLEQDGIEKSVVIVVLMRERVTGSVVAERGSIWSCGNVEDDVVGHAGVGQVFQALIAHRA